MKSKISIVLILFVIWPIMLSAQSGWQKKNVTIKGEIVDYQKYEKDRTIKFYFNDIISRDGGQDIYVAEIDSSGEFFIQIPIYYPQDFYLRNNYINTQLFCSEGDKLVLKINYNAKSVSVVGGNRVKDNNDFKNFIKGLKGIDDKSAYELAKIEKSNDYLKYIKNRERRFRLYFNKFKRRYKTSSLFNQFIDDYLKYETWNSLLAYPNWHALQNNIKKETIKLKRNYYAFLKEYNMNDENIFSTKHSHFLYSYYRYIIQNPQDSMNKVNRYLKKGDIISGAKILKNMILDKTSGFTKNLYLTWLYLDAIEGKQLKPFQAVYDSTDFTNRFFTNIIDRKYRHLQKFMANQNTKEANLRTINSKIVGNLIDTISTKYSNKVIYIDFWATWCSPCLAEIPYSKDLQRDYKNKDVVFLFLANRCSESAWKATIANKGLTGEHILLTTDQYNALAAEFNITGIPHYVLIDKKGNIISQNAPRPSQEKQIKLEIDRLLK